MLDDGLKTKRYRETFRPSPAHDPIITRSRPQCPQRKLKRPLRGGAAKSGRRLHVAGIHFGAGAAQSFFEASNSFSQTLA
jgi:hypothetical protein